MEATTIVRESRTELDSLALELFATTYGCDWEMAYALAAELLPSLSDFAFAWDFDAACLGNADAIEWKAALELAQEVAS